MGSPRFILCGITLRDFISSRRVILDCLGLLFPGKIWYIICLFCLFVCLLLVRIKCDRCFFGDGAFFRTVKEPSQKLPTFLSEMKHPSTEVLYGCGISRIFRRMRARKSLEVSTV
jgi:hypothetical protein